jgi:hypothetical protein
MVLKNLTNCRRKLTDTCSFSTTGDAREHLEKPEGEGSGGPLDSAMIKKATDLRMTGRLSAHQINY